MHWSCRCSAVFAVGLLGCSGDPYEPRTRVVYVAADEVVWNYAPDGINAVKGEPFDDEAGVFVTGDGDTRIGSSYKKALYRQYTDDSFSTLADESPKFGALGPVIHAVVGDRIEVVFKNNASLPYSIHPHGVFYDKANEGAGSNDGTSSTDKADDSVAPGDTYTYRWEVPERAGPGESDPSSVVWLYHSHVNSIQDSNAGLVGAIVVTDPKQARENGTPRDVDREIASLFTVYDENVSHYLPDNIAESAPNAVEDDDFAESNLMHAINGYVFGNGPRIEIAAGERVRWYLLALGTEVDLHTPHWHGNTVVYAGRHTDVVELLPASMKVADMVVDDPGTWLYHCHVNDHIAAGMITLYDVQ